MSNHPCLRALPGRVAARALALALCMVAPAMAERIEAPLELLHSPLNHLVVGTLAEINPAADRLVFKSVTTLGKHDAAVTLEVRAATPIATKVKIGQRYIFAYSEMRADPRRPLNMVRSAGGATLLVSPGLEPALFRDTQATRALLMSKIDDDDDKKRSNPDAGDRAREDRRAGSADGRRGDHDSAEPELKRLLRALQGADPALQNLAAAQIVYDAEIGERLDQPDRVIVGKVARKATTPANVRVTLLRAAANDEQHFGDWWKAGAREVVTTTPVDGYAKGAVDPSDLVLTALELLDRNSVPVASAALKRWLWSPNAALAERASLMLRRVSPAEQRTAIQQALADPKLPVSTRRFLGDHLRRMDRIDAKSTPRKEGSG